MSDDTDSGDSEAPRTETEPTMDGQQIEKGAEGQSKTLGDAED